MRQPKPISQEQIAEIDSRLMNVYSKVMQIGFDEDMSDIRRNALYMLLRMAYASGRRDGREETVTLVKEHTHD